jgi:hypothetical protein
MGSPCHGQEVLPFKGSKREFFKIETNKAGMPMKTKGGCGKLEDEAGMSQKIKDLFVLSGNVIERKGVIISR